MFRCQLCKGILTSGHEISATFCGHVFHHDCLEYFLISRTTVCPSCKKSLRVVDPGANTFTTSGFAIFSLYPYEGDPDHPTTQFRDVTDERKDAFKEALMQENMLLQMKLTQAVQAIWITKQHEKPKFNEMPQHNPSPEPDYYCNCISDFSTLQSESEDVPKVDEEEAINIKFLALRNKSFEKLNNEKNRLIVRSRQRKYLTWRNKVQSWLSKMTKASNRLFLTEKCFPPEDYLQHLRHFARKVETEGKIVEEANQAAMVYLFIGTLPPEEINAIHTKIKNLSEEFFKLKQSIANKIETVENLLPKNALSPKEKATWKIMDDKGNASYKVSICPKLYTQLQYLQISKSNIESKSEDSIYTQEPIFV